MGPEIKTTSPSHLSPVLVFFTVLKPPTPSPSLGLMHKGSQSLHAILQASSLLSSALLSPLLPRRSK